MEKKLKVSGMTCQHCVNWVTKIVSAFSGVSNVNVDLEKKEARFDYDPGKTDVQEIIKAIVDFGYQAIEG